MNEGGKTTEEQDQRSDFDETDGNARGAEIPGPVKDEGFGLLTVIRLPGGGKLGLNQPKHPSPLAR